jgi:cytochrome c-type biogenesis protein CcmF
LYISPVEYQPPFDRNIADLNEGETKEVGPYKITFNGFVVPMDHSASADISARLTVVYQGKSSDIVPGIVILADATDPAKAIQEMPVTMPGGHRAFDPSQKRVIINVGGLNLPIDPARAVVTVTVKPGVALVWGGIILGVIGGLLAVLRRSLEAGNVNPSVWSESLRAWVRSWRRDNTLPSVK